MSYNSEWSQCKSSQSLFESSIPVYTITSNAGKLVYLSMINYLNLIISSVRHIQIDHFTYELNNTNNISDDIFVLELNGLGHASIYLNQILKEILQCEIEQASQFSSLTTLLILIGSSMIGTCKLILVFFLLCATKIKLTMESNPICSLLSENNLCRSVWIDCIHSIITQLISINIIRDLVRTELFGLTM